MFELIGWGSREYDEERKRVGWKNVSVVEKKESGMRRKMPCHVSLLSACDDQVRSDRVGLSHSLVLVLFIFLSVSPTVKTKT